MPTFFWNSGWFNYCPYYTGLAKTLTEELLYTPDQFSSPVSLKSSLLILALGLHEILKVNTREALFRGTLENSLVPSNRHWTKTLHTLHQWTINHSKAFAATLRFGKAREKDDHFFVSSNFHEKELTSSVVWTWRKKGEWAPTPCQPWITGTQGYSHGQGEQMWQTSF